MCQRAPLSARPGDTRPLSRGLTKVRECERSQPLVPRVFTTTRYARSELWRPCGFCKEEVPAFEWRQHAKECGRRWLRQKNAFERRLRSAPRFPCGSCDKTFARSHLRNKHVRNRECQPSPAQTRNNVAVQAAPSKLHVARTSTRQQQQHQGASRRTQQTQVTEAFEESKGAAELMCPHCREMFLPAVLEQHKELGCPQDPAEQFMSEEVVSNSTSRGRHALLS